MWEVFDATGDPDVEEYALHLCADCPALEACREWFDGLPRTRRPTGVVAGRVAG